MEKHGEYSGKTIFLFDSPKEIKDSSNEGNGKSVLSFRPRNNGKPDLFSCKWECRTIEQIARILSCRKKKYALAVLDKREGRG
jgi:hypothetical protein